MGVRSESNVTMYAHHGCFLWSKIVTHDCSNSCSHWACTLPVGKRCHCPFVLERAKLSIWKANHPIATAEQEQRQLGGQTGPLGSPGQNVHVRALPDLDLGEEAFAGLSQSTLPPNTPLSLHSGYLCVCNTIFTRTPDTSLIWNMDSHSKDILYRPQRKIQEQSFKSPRILLSLVWSVVFRLSVSTAIPKWTPAWIRWSDEKGGVSGNYDTTWLQSLSHLKDVIPPVSPCFGRLHPSCSH